MAGQQEEMKIWEENDLGLKPIEVFMSAREMTEKLQNILNEFVNNNLIDFSVNQENPFIFEGRIYKRDDDAQFVIEILPPKDNRNENECSLEILRTGGNAFIFNEFKNQIQNRFSDFIENNHQNQIQNNNMFNFINENHDMEDKNIESLWNDNNSNHDNENEKYEMLVKNATDTSHYSEILKNDVISLLNIVENQKKIKHIATINNIFGDLFKPFHCDEESALLDTFIIKSLLKIISLLIEECKSTIWKNNEDYDLIEQMRKSIESIQMKWSQNVIHPLQIATLPQSQQIVRLCKECLSKLEST